MLLGRGIESVMRGPQRRQVDGRGGRRVGRADQVVSWPTPTRPAWLAEATDAVWPAPMAIRELRVRVTQRGCRTREGLVAPTVLEALVGPKEDLAGL